MDREPVRRRHVARDKVDFRLHQAGDKVHVPRESIELRDQQRGLGPAGVRDRISELGPVVFAATLDLPVRRR